MELWEQVPMLQRRNGQLTAYLKLCRRGKAAAVVRHDDIFKITMELGVINLMSKEDLAALAPDPAVLKGRGTSLAVLKKKYVSNLKALHTSLKRIDRDEMVDPFPGDREDGLPNFTAPGITLHPEFYRNYIAEVSIVHAKVLTVFEYGFEEAELVHYKGLKSPLVA